MSSKLQVTCLDHLNLNVKNLEKTVEFYRKIFGFKVFLDQTNPDRKSQIIGNEAVKLCLYEYPDRAEAKGMSHFGFHIENFDEILERCQELNIPLLYGGLVEWEKSKSIYIADPNGYKIELVQVRGGGL